MYKINKNLFSYYFNNLTFYNDRYSILNLKKKIELIWSYILKVMNFIICRNFSGIFLEFFWIYLIFISIFKYLISLKNAKNVGFIVRVHVALPRGQARAPTWRGGDVWHW